MCSLCWLLVAKKHNFGHILTFLGAPAPTPFYNEGQMWCAIAHPCPWYTFTCQISSRSAYYVVLWWRKPQFCRFFGIWHLMVSPIGSSLTKLNTDAQLQTFPYPTASKSLLYSNAFMAKSRAQTLTFKSVKDKQTDRQTDRKNSTFLATPAAGEIRAPPNLAW